MYRPITLLFSSVTTDLCSELDFECHTIVAMDPHSILKVVVVLAAVPTN
jgi:hypothetical protein